MVKKDFSLYFFYGPQKLFHNNYNITRRDKICIWLLKQHRTYWLVKKKLKIEKCDVRRK